MNAWITYEFLHTVELDGDGEEIDSYSFEYGTPVEVLCWLTPSYVSHKFAWQYGLFLVRNERGQISPFDGQFITFLNPNKKEIN